MKKTTLSLLVGMTVFGIASCSSKPKSHKHQPHLMAEKQSTVTSKMLIDQTCDLFESLDKEKNGFLNAEEQKLLPHWLKNVKPAHGEHLTIIDLTHAAQEAFSKNAKSNSNFLTAAEYQQLEAGK